MFPHLRRASALLFLFLSFGLLVRAQGLVSLDTTIVSSSQAVELTKPVPTPELPELTGPAAGLQPIVALEHYDSLWLLATDAHGKEVWLNHTDDKGWERRATPPVTLGKHIEPAGQANVLALVQQADNQVTIYTYNAVTDEWSPVGHTTVSGSIQGVESAQNGYLLLTRDSAGAEQQLHLSVGLTKRLLSWVDWVIIAAYLGFSAGIGFYYYIKEKKHSDEDFFLGGRNIPWWAAGVSLYATGTSAISYIATPAKSFATNWLYLAGNVTGMIGTVFVAIWIVPLIRRLNLMSVYHYLEMRFHPKLRLVASAIAIVMQLGGRMSMVLFLPALAMSAVTGVSVIYSILIMGVVTIIYTMLGGMKAVIWTDFIQVVVMLGGAFVAMGYILTHVDGGVAGFFKTAIAADKFETFDWSFNLTQATVWGFLLVAVMGVLTYPQDQVMMQRVLSTKSDKEAGWSVWTLAAIVVPGNLTFFGIGTALYVFYKGHPTHLNPMLNVDTTFPQFIASELPVGVTGLIIAGIFAASMSTLSGTMNSVATLVSVDFYQKFSKKYTQANSVRLAEIMTVIAGLIGIGTAVLLAKANIKSALDTWFEMMGLLGGGFGGCYALGLFTKRTNWQGAIIGVGASIVLTFAAWIVHLVHPYFYLPIATTICIVFGYFSSFLFPPPTQSLHGLTVYTPRKEPVVLPAK